MYLPYECTDNRDEFIDCLAKLGVYLLIISTAHIITIVGDFNANLSSRAAYRFAVYRCTGIFTRYAYRYFVSAVPYTYRIA